MNIVQELRLAARSLVRRPGFSVVAILTCALAIGACTSIYTVVYDVLLQPLPYPHADRLVEVWQLGKSGGQSQFSDPNFEDLRDQTHAFAAFAQFADGMTTVVAGTNPVRARVATVSAQFFDVFETPPRRGRLFDASERHEGAPPVAIVSDAFAHRTMAAGTDPLAVPLRIGERRYTVVGVMPSQFNFPAGTDVWTPREQDSRNPYRTGHNWEAVGRVSPSLSLASARADAGAVARRLKQQLGQDTAMSDVALIPLKQELTGSVEQSLLTLLGAVVCLLAIACANLANLSLVHIAGRQRELAVRAALGASRAALARPLIAEVIWVAAAGGAGGVALGLLGVRALLWLGPANLPRLDEISLNGPVLALTFATTVIVALALSVTSAWRAGRRDVTDGLRLAQRGQAGSRAASRVRNTLVVAELAVSLVLLVGAGLLGRSLAKLLNQNPGFRTDGVVAIDVSNTFAGAPDARPRLAAFHERALERLAALPGVAAAGGINRLPMGSSYANGTFLLGPDLDRVKSMDELIKLFADRTRTGSAEFRVASGGYFDAMGIPLVRGRLFDARDTIDAPHVAVISESLARASWPRIDPIGQSVQFGNMDGDLRLFTIVGVVGDICERGLDSNPRPTFYGDYRQRPRPTADFSLVLRTDVALESVTTAARGIVHDLDPDQAPRFRPIDRIVASSVSDRRFTAIVTGAFALSALLLAVVGIYGVLAYAVSQRLTEFGIRVALGAQRWQVWTLVLRQAALLVLAGTAAGLVLSSMSGALVRSLLFGIAPTDPATVAGVSLLLIAAALVACVRPAFRATRVDPVGALREQ